MWIFVELMLSVGLFIIIICVVDGYNNFSITNTKVLILVYIVKEFTYFMRCINDTISTSVQTEEIGTVSVYSRNFQIALSWEV